jgi:uncharacterized SAM-binding protein YcdF (DUF218 family)
MAKSRSWGRKVLFLLHLMLWLSLLAVLLIACTPLTRYMLAPLAVPEEVREADLIVVLGGGVNQGRYLNWVSSHRMVRGVQLYFDGKAKKILFSGGIMGQATVSEAAVMAQEARRLRVPAEGILQEKKAKNTHEQAVEVKKIADSLQAKSILLVTSFSHMKRSLMAFEHAGFKVYPASADPNEKYADSALGRLGLFPPLLHEYGGIVYYKMKGWI